MLSPRSATTSRSGTVILAASLLLGGAAAAFPVVTAAPASAASANVSDGATLTAVDGAPSPVWALTTWTDPGYETDLQVAFEASKTGNPTRYTVSLGNVTTGKNVTSTTTTELPFYGTPMHITLPNATQRFVVTVTASNDTGTSTESKAMITPGAETEPVSMLFQKWLPDGSLRVTFNAPNYSDRGTTDSYRVTNSGGTLLGTAGAATTNSVTLSAQQLSQVTDGKVVVTALSLSGKSGRPYVVTVTGSPAVTNVVTAKKTTAANGRDYLAVSGTTNKVAPGGWVYLWVHAPDGAATNNATQVQVTGINNYFTFDAPTADTALGTPGTYQVRVTASPNVSDAIADTSFVYRK